MKPEMAYEQLLSDEERTKFRADLFKAFQFANSCTGALQFVFNLINDPKMRPELPHAKTTVLALLRMGITHLDGIAFLTNYGGSEPCNYLLRSFMEVIFKVNFILKDQSENRALAYRYAELKHELKLLEGVDPARAEGVKIRGFLANCDLWAGLSPELDKASPLIQGNIALIEKELKKPMFAEVQKQWDAEIAKRAKPPQWHKLFNGKDTVRALAEEMNEVAFYLYHYDFYSDYVHVSNGYKGVNFDENGNPSFRLLRHPCGLLGILINSSNFMLYLSLKVLNYFCEAGHVSGFQQFVAEVLFPRKNELVQTLEGLPEWPP
jgi:hypothetical protein